MLFRYSLTIPASTTATDPATSVVNIAPGVLRHVSISFPPGCAALAHVAVLYQEHQIVPASTGEFLAWDDLTLAWPEDIPIDEVPHEFKLVGWNEDDTYPHTVTFRFDILGPRGRAMGGIIHKLFGA